MDFNLKIALICYHKNVKNIYHSVWINQFKRSILCQTYKEFDIYEIEYGGGDFRIFEESNYEVKELPTFVDAMNHLLDKCFSLGYDYCLNCNVDDFFSLDRVEKQLEEMKKGTDIIGSNFSLIREGMTIHTHHFDILDIATELTRKNNILCHPVIAYSAKFWKGNRYKPETIPFEDMILWQEAIEKGYSFIILPEVLCFHRLHSNSVCQNENNR